MEEYSPDSTVSEKRTGVLYAQLLEEKEHSIRQYNFGGVYWPRYSRSDSIASGERTIQSSSTASGERTVWSYIVSLRGSVLCSHYILGLAEQELDQEGLEISDLFAY